MSKLISTNPAKNYEVVGEAEVPTADELERRGPDLAKMITAEMGKSISQARLEVRSLVEEFRFKLISASE